MAVRRVLASPPRQIITLLTMTVEAGYDAHFKSGAWVPLRIVLNNTGDAIEGEVTLENDHTSGLIERYAQTVSLDKGARRLLTLYVPSDTASFEVTFRHNHQTLITATPLTRQMGDTDRLIVVAGDPPDSFNFLGDLNVPYGGRSVVAPINLAQLPDHAPALDSIDVLIFSNVDSGTLSDGQRQAVEAWVNAGGHLILNGGPGAALAINGFKAIAPARIGQALINGSVISLRNYFASAILDSPAANITSSVPAITLQPQPNARTLAGAAETPLLVRRELGHGLIDQLAFDPGLTPLRDWPGRVQLFSALLGGRLNLPLIVGPLREDSNPTDVINAVPAAILPSVLLIGGFLIAYVLTIGPLNFLLLRRFKRQTMAWISVPTLALAFTAFSALTGFRLHGNSPQVHRLNLSISDSQSQNARSYNLIGLFAPRRTEVMVDLGNGLAQTLIEVRNTRQTTATVTQQIGDPSQINNLTVGGSDTRAMYVQGQQPVNKLDGSLNFIPQPITDTRRASQVTGELTNNTGTLLQDCVLVVGKDYQVLGDIGIDQRMKVAISLLLNASQPAMNLRAARLGKERYYKGFYTNRNIRSARNSSAPTAAPGTNTRLPFDLNGDPITNALVNWKESNRDDLNWQAEYGLVYNLLGEERLGAGAHIACWNLPNTSAIALAGAGYTDRTLHVWRMPVQTLLATPGTRLPSDAFTWNVINSSSLASFDDQGMILEHGQHIIAFSPWLPVRSTGNTVELVLQTAFNPSTPLPALRATQLSLFNWRTQRYQKVVTSADILRGRDMVRGPFLSASGEVRLRIDVNGDPISLTDLGASVQVR